jgi:hypothetical protein
MTRRFETNYVVKPKDNLGDPQYWNKRFEDIDRRVSASEDAITSINTVEDRVESLALERLNLILAPALNQVAYASEQGFLLAHSNTSVTLADDATLLFIINEPNERQLFAPSPFMTVVREANMTDYAFLRKISYSKTTGELTAVVEQRFGASGPFTDWQIYTGAAVSQAVIQMLHDSQDARDAAISAKSNAETARDVAQGYRNEAEGFKNTASTKASEAAASAAAAATFDPALYAPKASPTFTGTTAAPTPSSADDTTKIATTAFTKNTSLRFDLAQTIQRSPVRSGLD